MSGGQRSTDHPPVRPWRRRLQFSLRTGFVLVLFLILAMGIWTNWYRLPGTLYRDERGFPHGTGQEEFFYPSGRLMAVATYYNGLETQMTWFKPDGKVVAMSQFSKENGGFNYLLNDDGSIRRRYRYEYRPSKGAFIAHGEATDYAPDGSVLGVEQYVEGQPANGWDALRKYERTN